MSRHRRSARFQVLRPTPTTPVGPNGARSRSASWRRGVEFSIGDSCDFAEFLACSLYLHERGPKVAYNGSDNVIGIGERFLGRADVVTKPCDV